MHKVVQFDPILRWLNRGHVRVGLCWTAGLVLGTLIAARADTAYLQMMRLAAGCRVSIVGLIAAAFLPFLFATYAVFISRPALLLAVCFCKAFCFSCCAFMACAAFGSAGWLVQPMLQFTDICMVPVLCWFCIRHISGPIISVKRNLWICGLIALLAAGIDYTVVSPFLAKLIDF